MRVHDNAFLGLIKADTQLTSAVYEGTVTNPPARYVSVFTRESREVNRYTGPHSLVTNEYIVHTVATTPEQAKWTRERVLTAVLDVTPVVTGWRCHRINFVTSQPLATDRDVSPPLYYCVDVYSFAAQAA